VPSFHCRECKVQSRWIKQRKTLRWVYYSRNDKATPLKAVIINSNTVNAVSRKRIVYLGIKYTVAEEAIALLQEILKLVCFRIIGQE
jgi:predicted peptidase